MYGILSVYCWSSDSTEWHLWLILKKPFGRFLFEGEALIFFWIEDFPKPHEDVSSSCHAHEQSSFWSIHQSLYFGSDHLTSLEEQHPAVTSTLDRCLYVYDLICCAQSVEAADGSSQLAQTMQEWIYANGAQTLENIEIKWKNTVFKVLGLMWGIEEDDFVFEFDGLFGEQRGRVTSYCTDIWSSWMSFSFYHPSEMSFPANVGTWSWMGQWAT